MAKLGEALSLDKRRLEWTKYIYRFDDIESVASILEHGALFSRKTCDERDIGHRDAADREVVQLNLDAHKFARLYFRPRTPTQFWMEGIRAKHEIRHEAHCPVPVFLLFDAVGMLTRPEARFSQRTIGRGGVGSESIGDTFEFFRKLKFDLIYHDGPIRADENKELIKQSRHAEILFEGEVDLADLKWIVCRTEPEMRTLLSLLSPEAMERWRGIVRTEGPIEGLFERRGTFVTDVRLHDKQLRFDFEPHIGPFEIKLTVDDPVDKTVLVKLKKDVEILKSRHHVLLPKEFERVRAKLQIDGNLAFAGFVRQTKVYS